jgi:hypothetical protein
MSRVPEIASPSVARMIAEYRLSQMTKALAIDREQVEKMSTHLEHIKQMRPVTPGKGENVDITV